MKQLSMIPEKSIGFPMKKPAPQRGEFYRFYRTAIWQKIRRQKLQDNPCCEKCIKHGRIRRGYAIDHKRPHKGRIKVFLDFNNMQTLCHSCHSRKSAMEKVKRGK